VNGDGHRPDLDEMDGRGNCWVWDRANAHGIPKSGLKAAISGLITHLVLAAVIAVPVWVAANPLPPDYKPDPVLYETVMPMAVAIGLGCWAAIRVAKWITWRK
jgi:hypothetical protein